jgi:hypothetical protein
MARIHESIQVRAAPRQIWEYVQDYRRRAEWDPTTLRFEPVDSQIIGTHVRVHLRGEPPRRHAAKFLNRLLPFSWRSWRP